MTSSPWDDAYEITVSPEAAAALAVARTELDALGHGTQDFALEPDPSYGPAFRTLWQAGAAGIPAQGEQLDLLEPLTQWLVQRGRELTAQQLSGALLKLAAYERSVIRQFAGYDAVLHPGDGADTPPDRLVRHRGCGAQLRAAGAVHAVDQLHQRQRPTGDQPACR